MRAASLSLALGWLAVAAAPHAVAGEDPVAVAPLTLDELRQFQAAYGEALLAGLARRGSDGVRRASLPPQLAEACQDERLERSLDYCVRFHLTRAADAADGPPTVVVALDDLPAGSGGRSGEMRATCFGRGVRPRDATGQTVRLWPGAARMHGMRDLEADRAALSACIAAAASEPWAGLRQPD